MNWLKSICCAICHSGEQPNDITQIVPTSSKEVDWAYINNLLTTKFPSPTTHIYLSDNKYYLCSFGDIEKFLAQDNTNKLTYAAEVFDCDDFSYRLMGQLSYPNWSGIAFGIVWSDTHALNCLISEDGEFFFIEPQTDKLQKELEPWQGTEVLLVVM